jgi:Reverse transcriptase (RNA-dependent DNA polymerase)
LMEVLKDIGVDWRDRRLIANLYMGQIAVVRTDDGETEPIMVGRGTRQGCPLSPVLFNIYDEAMAREAFDNIKEGVKIGGKLIKEVRFADDKGVLASTEKGLQRLITSLDKVATNYGMKISIKKTKVMLISRRGTEELNIMLNDNKLEQVTHFKYLGGEIVQDGRSSTEIKKRIAMGKDAFNKRKVLLTKSLDLQLKKRIVKSTIWSVVLYACETWTLTKQDIKRIEAFEMWIWRRIQKISWTDRVTNEEVLRRVNEKRCIIEQIMKRQRNWIGHVLRGNSLLRETIEGRIKGKCLRGRPRQKMLDNILNGHTYANIKKIAQDRLRWKRLNQGTCQMAEH